MEATDRVGLPLLSSGQAQKEQSHNEALARLDLLVQPVVQAVAPAAVPGTPRPGDCWVVGSNATGAWSGHDGELAGWTSGGWRFVALPVGAQVWSVADESIARRSAAGWAVGELRGARLLIGSNQVIGPRGAAVPAPGGGTTVDTEARAAIVALTARLSAHGLIATS